MRAPGTGLTDDHGGTMAKAGDKRSPKRGRGKTGQLPAEDGGQSAHEFRLSEETLDPFGRASATYTAHIDGGDSTPRAVNMLFEKHRLNRIA